MQNATIDVALDREDTKELGNSEVVARGVKDKTVTVTFGRILEDAVVGMIISGNGNTKFGHGYAAGAEPTGIKCAITKNIGIYLKPGC